MKLFLFTNFFPLKRSEPFLVNEFEITKRNFNAVTVFPLFGTLTEIKQTTGCTVLSPPLASTKLKAGLFFSGIFNLAPLKFHLKEIFSKKLYVRAGALYWHAVSFLITRTILSSPSLKDLLDQLKKSERSVLYFYWADNMCWIIPYITKFIDRNKTKVVVRLHRTDLYEELKAAHAPLREKILACADIIVPVSQHGVSYLKQKYPEFASKIILSRLGVFDHGLNPAPGDNKVYSIVSVSSIVAVKRVRLLFLALQKSSLNILWHHFGDGPLMSELETELKSCRPDLKVKLHGFVENKQVMDFYKRNPVHLFINVSESEGLPVSIMEALSFGLPVLATHVGGVADVVDDTVGGLLPSDVSADQIASEVERILKKEVESYNLKRGSARRLFEQKLTAEKNYQEFYKMIADLFTA